MLFDDQRNDFKEGTCTNGILKLVFPILVIIY